MDRLLLISIPVKFDFLGCLVAAGLLLATAPDAYAQFTTPNRSFHNATAFPLEGQHLAAPCQSCHLSDVYKGTPTTCFECHWVRRKDDRFQTRLGSDCSVCHRPASWTAVRWDHAATTGTPLNSAHRAVGCQSCHRGGDFRPAAVTCVNCHQRDYQATTSPNNAAAGFPTICEACHRPSDESFRLAVFDHNAVFPLQGVHATQACQACHVNNVFRGTARDCVGCHRPLYDRTTSPAHAPAGFPTTCDQCHRPTDPAWTGTVFDHNAVFPLQGVHATQSCQACHVNNVFRGTARDCVGCHRALYDRTTNPPHAPAGFPTSCEQCHKPTDPAWAGTPFNHNAVFLLQGVHAVQTCQACHVNNVFKGTPRDCVGCHRPLYDRTTSPAHAPAGFPTTCDQCHRPTDPAWTGTAFDHNVVFPLQGVHVVQTCQACHVNNVFKGTPRNCAGCHRALYDRTTSPPHAAAGFGTTCEQCHKATDPAWKGVAFNHNAFFALQGVHAAQACQACHVNNVFKGTARDCVGCHRTVYDRTTSPNHQASGFPTTCDSCHKPTDATWQQGTFTHTRFPLSGPHKVTCAQCHTTPNYQEFSCIVCHGRAQTDNQHRGRNGYRYDSLACYSCHPTGKGN